MHSKCDSVFVQTVAALIAWTLWFHESPAEFFTSYYTSYGGTEHTNRYDTTLETDQKGSRIDRIVGHFELTFLS